MPRFVVAWSEMREMMRDSATIVEPPRSKKLSWLVVVSVGGLCLALGVEVYHVLSRNFHTIIPGRAYRCAQQTPAELEELVRIHGIRTVINLRGCCASCPWYVEEGRTTHRLNIAQEDIGLSAGRYPSISELRRLVEVLDHTEYPILIHCRQGADRTGLAATIIKFLQSDVGLSEARRQLALRFGHLALGRTANLDRFLDLYERWLRNRELSHSGQAFRQWLAWESCPGEYQGRLEPLDFPARIELDQAIALRVRAHNTSESSWHFQKATNAGIHVCFGLLDAEGQYVAFDRAGLFDAEVLPGQSIDLTLPLPPLPQPGQYRLIADLMDEAHCVFHQVASEPLEWNLTVGKGP